MWIDGTEATFKPNDIEVKSRESEGFVNFVNGQWSEDILGHIIGVDIPTQFICSKEDECNTNPCQNNGICLLDADSETGTFKCACTPQFTGTTCADDVNECTSLSHSPKCVKGQGVCRNKVGGFRCQCFRGFTGNRCEIKINGTTTSADDVNGSNGSSDQGIFLLTSVFLLV